MTWGFTLDNSANHISKIVFTENGAEAGKVRGGTLDVRLSGGVLLSDKKTFTLIEAPDILSESNFVNAANYEGPTAGLWVQNVEGSTSLKITLNEACKQGRFFAVPNATLNFAKAGRGYVELVNTNRNAPLVLALDVAGGILRN